MRTASLRAIALACTVMTAGAGNAWADQAMDNRIASWVAINAIRAKHLPRDRRGNTGPSSSSMRLKCLGSRDRNRTRQPAT